MAIPDLDIRWPPGTPPAARADWPALLPESLVLANRMIRRRGGFQPYGMSLGADGRFEPLGSIADTPQEMLFLMRDFCRISRGARLAVAMVTDVRVRSDTGVRDAIQIDLEHRAAPPIAVVLPYEHRGLLRAVGYGQPWIIGDRTRHIWTDGGTAETLPE